MSSEASAGDRDLAAELAQPAAGQAGIPVDEMCVGCGRTRVKRARPELMDQPADVDPTTLKAADCTSFKHVCHQCQTATWWNPVAVLSGLVALEDERGE